MLSFFVGVAAAAVVASNELTMHVYHNDCQTILKGELELKVFFFFISISKKEEQPF